jgi:hypothetical protein
MIRADQILDTVHIPLKGLESVASPPQEPLIDGRRIVSVSTAGRKAVLDSSPPFGMTGRKIRNHSKENSEWPKKIGNDRNRKFEGYHGW